MKHPSDLRVGDVVIHAGKPWKVTGSGARDGLVRAQGRSGVEFDLHVDALQPASGSTRASGWRDAPILTPTQEDDLDSSKEDTTSSEGASSSSSSSSSSASSSSSESSEDESSNSESEEEAVNVTQLAHRIDRLTKGSPMSTASRIRKEADEKARARIRQAATTGLSAKEYSIFRSERKKIERRNREVSR